MHVLLLIIYSRINIAFGQLNRKTNTQRQQLSLHKFFLLFRVSGDTYRVLLFHIAFTPIYDNFKQPSICELNVKFCSFFIHTKIINLPFFDCRLVNYTSKCIKLNVAFSIQYILFDRCFLDKKE
jgi:hypothetical protein